MSVLLIDPPTEIGEEVITRLVRQGDEVRVLERNPTRATLWTRLGAHVARGDPSDDDLIERAATNCRTVVTFSSDGDLLAAAASGARAARVERMIAVVDSPTHVAGNLEMVVLVTRPKRVFRKATPPAAIAAAIDAADDMAQVPERSLDLADGAAWRLLRLDEP